MGFEFGDGRETRAFAGLGTLETAVRYTKASKSHHSGSIKASLRLYFDSAVQGDDARE